MEGPLKNDRMRKNGTKRKAQNELKWKDLQKGTE